MIRKKLKSLMYLTLCLALLSGCSNKEENHDITDSNNQTESVIKLDAPVKTVIEEVSTVVDNIQPDNEKEVLDTKKEVADTKTESQPAEEVKPITLTEEEFYSKDIVIPDNKPFEMTISFNVINMTFITNPSTNDIYYNIAGNEFMYVDGVNYVIDKNNPIKYKGENIMLNNASGTASVDVEDPFAMLDTLKINDINVVSDIIVINGDISYSGIIAPAIIKIDYNTYEFISLTINQDNTYVSYNILDSWNDLPDLNYKEVDMETVEEKVKESILMIMAGAFSVAFSEESLTEELESTTETDSSSVEEVIENKYKIPINNITVGLKGYIRDFTWNELGPKYGITSTYFDSDLSYFIWTEEELNDEDINSIKDEIIEFLKSEYNITLEE